MEEPKASVASPQPGIPHISSHHERLLHEVEGTDGQLGAILRCVCVACVCVCVCAYVPRVHKYIACVCTQAYGGVGGCGDVEVSQMFDVHVGQKAVWLLVYIWSTVFPLYGFSIHSLLLPHLCSIMYVVWSDKRWTHTIPHELVAENVRRYKNILDTCTCVCIRGYKCSTFIYEYAVCVCMVCTPLL